MYSLKNFPLLSLFLKILLISVISSAPTFTITGVDHVKTHCDYVTIMFHFTIMGQTSGIDSPISIIFTLAEPTYPIPCTIDPKGGDGYATMTCDMDGLVYDLGNQRLVLTPQAPKIEGVEFLGWTDVFKPENLVINDNTNCKGDVSYDYAFATLSSNINKVGCFREKNNFSFEVKKLRSYDNDDPVIFFNMNFTRPDDEIAYCAMPFDGTDTFTVNCAIDYSGEIEIGNVHNTYQTKDGKDKVIFIRGENTATKLDECPKK